MIAIALGMLVTIGFGACGAIGLFASGREGGALAKIFGLIGLGLGALFGWLVWFAIKTAGSRDEPPQQ
jgi:hypothetical protein